MSERPQNRHLKPFKPKGDQPMSGRLFVRVTSDIEQLVKSLPDSPAWLRRVITEAARRELLGENASAPPQLTDNLQAEPDRAELVELLDTALGMTKAKDIKPLLEKIKGLLTQDR
ncbi:hypothetical protein LQF76_05870 [Gloeomargaritales cyanobacterium VI4D9]|nr:hypothetical protein LQF76_13020 [Gloeomargaritales cyanobacterium VI4D9]WAS06406.1 hypothetical protein LQF76_05870 [Gloeomargaritales cyanobacterium VI4D9]